MISFKIKKMTKIQSIKTETTKIMNRIIDLGNGTAIESQFFKIYSFYKRNKNIILKKIRN